MIASAMRALASDAVVFTGLCALVVASKLPVLATPYYWDETLWIGFAHKLARGDLWEVLPGLHEPFRFGNRPPGLFLPMAALFQVAGASISLSHAFVVCFAVVGVWYTYRLAALWFGREAGVLAALFLFLNATYFAQSAMFLADLPAAALAVAAVYYGVQRRFGAYFACAVYLIFIKETAMAVVGALAAWAFLVETRTSLRTAVADGARYAAPLLVVVPWYAGQWLATGHAFVRYEFEFEPFAGGLRAALDQLPYVHRWVVWEQGRWLFSAVILAALARPAFRRREVLLVALIVVAAGYGFTLLYFLPRYVLPVAPFFFAAGAGALVELLRDRRLRLGAAAAILLMLVRGLEEDPPRGNREWNMGYLDVVRTHREACAFIERELGGHAVQARFPFVALLSRPELGYVTAPLDVSLPPPPGRDAAPAPDVIVAAFPGGVDPLDEVAARRNLRPVGRFGDGEIRVTVYVADGVGRAS